MTGKDNVQQTLTDVESKSGIVDYRLNSLRKEDEHHAYIPVRIILSTVYLLPLHVVYTRSYRWPGLLDSSGPTSAKSVLNLKNRKEPKDLLATIQFAPYFNGLRPRTVWSALTSIRRIARRLQSPSSRCG